MSSIANAKKTMGWTGSRMRDACHNCKHGEARLCDREPGRQLWHCRQGGFMTGPMAICNRYQRTWA